MTNERQELQTKFNESLKQTLDAIKNLKNIQEVLLAQMEANVEQLLSGDDLIRVLNESVSVSEYVAEKLSSINSVNEQLESAKVKYAGVSSRATSLYFILQDLRKINPMYQFSLLWFKDMFKKSIQMTNVVRPPTEEILVVDENAPKQENQAK